ncbi:MAG: hypothetical protein PHY47_10235 [Lachnospiraceae bacterium]|nr:hypothetical protein [Lachnospiraceae bacterium]
MMETKVKANEKQKKAVKEVMKELFGITPSSEDDDAVMKSFRGYAEKLKIDLDKLDIYYSNQPKYPGKYLLMYGKKLMAETLQMKYSGEFFAGIDKKKDDYLDFAEDYEPVKKFFTGEQKSIFDRAIKLMNIYEDSKTFVVDSEIEKVVADVNEIMKKQAPYGEIFKMPELLDNFINLYGTLLSEMQKPVEAAIAEARKRVFDELEGKLCHDVLKDRFVDLFSEINNKAETCNNVATLQNIKVEADALKVRCLNEIEKKETELTPKPEPIKEGDGKDTGEEPPKKVAPVKRRKTISIKTVNNASSWQIETEEDVKQYIAELEKKLINSLEDNTIINIEF